jgi:hypothetical protein
MEEYVVEDSVPTDVPSFTRGIIESLKPAEKASAKTSASFGAAPIFGAAKPGQDEPDKKKQKKVTGKKNTDFTKLGLFHAKDGIEDGKVFPNNLKQPLCSKFCLQGKARHVTNPSRRASLLMSLPGNQSKRKIRTKSSSIVLRLIISGLTMRP